MYWITHSIVSFFHCWVLYNVSKCNQCMYSIDLKLSTKNFIIKRTNCRHIYITMGKNHYMYPCVYTHFLTNERLTKKTNIRINFHNWFNQIITQSGIYIDLIVKKKNRFFKPERLHGNILYQNCMKSPLWIWVNP